MAMVVFMCVLILLDFFDSVLVLESSLAFVSYMRCICLPTMPTIYTLAYIVNSKLTARYWHLTGLMHYDTFLDLDLQERERIIVAASTHQ